MNTSIISLKYKGEAFAGYSTHSLTTDCASWYFAGVWVSPPPDLPLLRANQLLTIALFNRSTGRGGSKRYISTFNGSIERPGNKTTTYCEWLDEVCRQKTYLTSHKVTTQNNYGRKDFQVRVYEHKDGHYHTFRGIDPYIKDVVKCSQNRGSPRSKEEKLNLIMLTKQLPHDVW